jgi:uncharacterized membrane protein (DUF485 family)
VTQITRDPPVSSAPGIRLVQWKCWRFPITDTLKPDQGLSSSYLEVQKSQEFLDLRSRFRRFVFPVTGLFLGWYFLYVALAAFAPVFMSHKLVGNLNVGLFLGLGQFVSTFVITMVYARWADKHFDPVADKLRAEIEGTV